MWVIRTNCFLSFFLLSIEFVSSYLILAYFNIVGTFCKRMQNAKNILTAFERNCFLWEIGTLDYFCIRMQWSMKYEIFAFDFVDSPEIHVQDFDSSKFPYKSLEQKFIDRCWSYLLGMLLGYSHYPKCWRLNSTKFQKVAMPNADKRHLKRFRREEIQLSTRIYDLCNAPANGFYSVKLLLSLIFLVENRILWNSNA